MGEINGYFPTIGLKTYDLYGEAIIKATRYESFRKQLFSTGIEKASIITMEDKVYQHLSAETRKQLIRFNLSEHQVRDDPDAKALYYKTTKESFYSSAVS